MQDFLSLMLLEKAHAHIALNIYIVPVSEFSTLPTHKKHNELLLKTNIQSIFIAF